jgi:hypothetical protein
MPTPLYCGQDIEKIPKLKYTWNYLKWPLLFMLIYQTVAGPPFFAWLFAKTSVFISPIPGRFWRKAYFQGVFGDSGDMVVTEKVAEKS